MKYNSIIFTVFILIISLIVSYFFHFSSGKKARVLWIVSLLGAFFFVLWQVIAINTYWYSLDKYVLGPSIARISIENIFSPIVIAFFVGVLWEVVFCRKKYTIFKNYNYFRMVQYGIGLGLLILGVYMFLPVIDIQYTGIALVAFGVAMLFDCIMGTGLLLQMRFYAFLFLMFCLYSLYGMYFNTQFAITYASAYITEIYVYAIPIENFIYFFAFITFIIVLYQKILLRTSFENLIEQIIHMFRRWKLKNYKVAYQTINYKEDERRATPSVAIVGASMAGLTAAFYLSKKNYKVTIYEKESYIGGKYGVKEEETGSSLKLIGYEFHRFFESYYNMWNFIHDLKIENAFKKVSTYSTFLDNRKMYLSGNDLIPVLNVFRRAQVNSLRYFLGKDILKKIPQMLKFHHTKTFARYDSMSVDDFFRVRKISVDSMTCADPLVKTFLSNGDKLSAAEFLKNMHIHYFSNDKGMLYGYVDGSYVDAFLMPIQNILQMQGVKIKKRLVKTVRRKQECFSIHSSSYDYVILSTGEKETVDIMLNSFPDECNNKKSFFIRKEECNTRHITMTVWIKGTKENPIIHDDDRSVFITTERKRLLDAVSFVDRINDKMREWAQRNFGTVLTLHCYEGFAKEKDKKIEMLLLEDLYVYFPYLKQRTVHFKNIQFYNSVLLQKNTHAKRPSVESGMSGLYYAGEWVKLPIPAAYIEAACASGIFSVNEIFKREKISQIPIYSVPLQGIYA